MSSNFNNTSMALNQHQSSDGLNYNPNSSNIALDGAFKPPSQISNLTKNLLLLLHLLDNNVEPEQQQQQQQQLQLQLQPQQLQQYQQNNPHQRLQQQHNEHFSNSLNEFQSLSNFQLAHPSYQGEPFSNLVLLEPNYPPQPPSYSNSASSSLASHKFIPSSEFLAQSIPNHHPSYDPGQKAQMPIPYQPASSFRSGSIAQSNNSFQQFNTPVNDSLHYIPSSHNTPTVVSTSYSSNHSYTPTQATNNFVPQSTTFHPSTSSKGIIPNAIPTTNLSMDSANSNSNSNSHSNSTNSTRESFSYQNPQSNQNSSPSVYIPPTQNQRFSSSFSSNSFQNQPNQPQTQTQTQNQNQNHQSQPPFYNRILTSVNERVIGSNNTSLDSTPNGNTPTVSLHSDLNSEPSGNPSLPPQSASFFPHEPDHYMSYKEFLHNLSAKDPDTTITSESAEGNGSIYEEHLNIVDYPVNDLILMLSCLLSKIIEANDKLHPNHFDNTISIRQKLKEEKKLKKMQRASAREERRREGRSETGPKNEDNIDVDIDHNCSTIEVTEDDEEDDEDDEEDEMKNKYLANVLAFHGTNVPGISLHAYLARVLKYCPVTNEVFLSLLVYFDRIAKKANNLRQKKKDNEDDGESEQLFVMDSYNIHRLIISGITVSSKFFSDIFYKNLRYAKVGGLPLEELNYLELQFLLLLDFKLMISVEDLQNYGDLLLRFWKREQITNELVNPPPKPQEVPFQN